MDPIQVAPRFGPTKYPVYEFDGVRFHRDVRGYYVSNKSRAASGASVRGQKLHRVVWAAAHGPIADKHEVHHKNGDKSDNRLENLECLPQFDHRHHHKSTPEHRAQAREAMRLARVALAEWEARNPDHRKTAGYQRRARERLPKVAKICAQCGGNYECHQYEQRRSKFCSRKCKWTARNRSVTPEQRKLYRQRAAQRKSA
jgi:hypothetical protein